jgi:hypothetical protein
MTETLLVKVEEKVMLLLAEVEKLRAEVYGLKQVNATMTKEKEVNTNKLNDLLALFDSFGGAEEKRSSAAAA